MTVFDCRTDHWTLDVRHQQQCCQVRRLLCQLMILDSLRSVYSLHWFKGMLDACLSCPGFMLFKGSQLLSSNHFVTLEYSSTSIPLSHPSTCCCNQQCCDLGQDAMLSLCPSLIAYLQCAWRCSAKNLSVKTSQCIADQMLGKAKLLSCATCHAVKQHAQSHCCVKVKLNSLYHTGHRKKEEECQQEGRPNSY